MNSVALVGTLARAPVVRFAGDGVQTCTFTLSVQETSAGGKAWTLFAPCIAYGRSAEAASLLSAEDLVSVQGKLGWHKRKAQCGEDHSVLVVSVREVQALQGPPRPGPPHRSAGPRRHLPRQRDRGGNAWGRWAHGPDAGRLDAGLVHKGRQAYERSP